MPRSDLAMFLEHLLTLDDQGVIQELTKLVRAKQPEPEANIELIHKIITTIESDDPRQF